MFTSELVEYIKECLKSGKPFSLFRLPKQKEWRISCRDGYSVLINNFNSPYVKARDVNDYDQKLCCQEGTDKLQYLSSVNQVIESHNANPYSKTVISRVIVGRTDIDDIIKAAQRYFEVNRDLFCMLALTKGDEIILLATPELLLEIKNRHFRTMALAGTRRLDSEREWDAKNIREHRIVEQYIEKSLKGCGLEFDKTAPFTKTSNNIEHICVEFNGHLRKDQDITTIVDTISPTPAVCGYPRETAYKKIKEHETHRRGLYAGYTVVKTPDFNTYVYVNLRFAVIDVHTGNFAIIVGGGITAESDAEKEWQETEIKAASLLECLTKK